MKNYLIIPILNEEKSIPLVLRDLDFNDFEEVIAVDNGSTDRSIEELAKFDVTVLKESSRGYGSACLKGLDYLSQKKMVNSDYIYFIDGDYSDHPQELKLLMSEAARGAQVIIGSRMRGEMEVGAMAPHARFGNWLATFILKLLYKHYQFTDLGPMRGINWGSLELIKMEDKNFGWTIELQVKALKEKLKCIEIPVSYRKRIGTSKISGTIKGSVMAGYIILYSIWKYR